MVEGGGSVASVELFDPAQNTVHELGSLAERRAGHTSTPLADGRVLIAGGYNGAYLASLEVFDASERRFHPAGFLREGRSGHTTTLLPDGRILIVGGIGRGWTFLRSAEVYDPATGRAEPVGSMAVPRESHTATLLADGRVLVIGGHSGRRPNVELYASAELFDPRTRRFENAGTLAIARHKHDAIRLADGRVLVIGGADQTDRVHYATTEIYSPESGAFERGPSMANRRYKIAGTAILLPTGDVLVASGAPVAELLDAGRWSFREVPGRFPAAYRFAAATLLREGDVFVAGGYSDGNQNTAGVWRFGQR
jgi:N-acetylneuraminic acid mutarotase